MRLFVFVTPLIPCLTVEGSEVFGQCIGKCGLKIFNWEEDERVADRMLYFPAVPATPVGQSRKLKTGSLYQDKMILDTMKSDSMYHPVDCEWFKAFRANRMKSLKIQLGLGSETVDVSAEINCKAPFRAGTVGAGPYSPLMKTVRKLELTIKRRKYRTLTSGPDLDNMGYIFADHTMFYSEENRSTHKYQNAWSLNGAIKVGGTSRIVKIVLGSLSFPTLEADPTVYKMLIGGVTFVLRGDQFSRADDDTIVVNPIVLGYYYDISILLDTSEVGKPKVGLKILASRLPYLS